MNHVGRPAVPGRTASIAAAARVASGERRWRLGAALLAGTALLALALVAGLGLHSGPARAAFPGQNGRIFCSGDRSVVLPRAPEPRDPALSSRREVYSMDPETGDAGGVTLHTNNDWDDGDPKVSPDGNRVAFESYASSSSEAYVMNTDGSGVRRLSFRIGEDGDPDWSPDGATLATGSSDATIRLWTREGAPLKTLSGHMSVVTGVAWSLDGTTIVSASSDTTIRLWTREGAPLKALSGHASIVHSVAWSPDGTTLASSSSDATIVLWR